MTSEEVISKIESDVCRLCTTDGRCDDCEFQIIIDILEYEQSANSIDKLITQISRRAWDRLQLHMDNKTDYHINPDSYCLAIAEATKALVEVLHGYYAEQSCGQAIDRSEVKE